MQSIFTFTLVICTWLWGKFVNRVKYISTLLHFMPSNSQSPPNLDDLASYYESGGVSLSWHNPSRAKHDVPSLSTSGMPFSASLWVHEKSWELRWNMSDRLATTCSHCNPLPSTFSCTSPLSGSWRSLSFPFFTHFVNYVNSFVFRLNSSSSFHREALLNSKMGFLILAIRCVCSFSTY